MPGRTSSAEQRPLATSTSSAAALLQARATGVVKAPATVSPSELAVSFRNIQWDGAAGAVKLIGYGQGFG